MNSLAFSIHRLIWSANNSSCISSFLIRTPFFLTCLTALAKTSSTILNRSGECEHPCLIPDLKRKTLNFSPLSIMLAVGLSHMAFVLFSSLFAKFIERFHQKWMLNFVKTFPVSIVIIMWFLFFSLLAWCITLIDLHILKNSCFPGTNPTWSWCMILSMYCWIWLGTTLLKIFDLCSSVMLACHFLFLWYICHKIYIYIYIYLVSGTKWIILMTLDIWYQGPNG